MLVSEIGSALTDALGGSLSQAQLDSLSSLVPLPDSALDREFFILVAAFAERLFCYGQFLMILPVMYYFICSLILHYTLYKDIILLSVKFICISITSA